MRFQTTLAVLTAAMPFVAQAECSGQPLEELLSPQQTAAIVDAVAQTPYAEGLFWEATRGDDRLVIAGTMHLPDPRHDALLARLTPEIAAADILLVEMTREDEATMLTEMTANPSLMYLTEGPTLIDLVDPETWAEISEAALARQIPPFMAAKFQPWFLMVTLSIPPCAMADMQSGGFGLDHMLMAEAGAANIPVQSLEPWDMIFSLFSSSPIEEQIDLLKTALIAPEITERAFASTLNAYFSEDVAYVWELSRTAMEFIPDLTPQEANELMDLTEAQLLTGRNADWVPVIEAATDTHDDIFVAAGAAHLPGDGGLLRLLEADGWAIRPLN